LQLLNFKTLLDTSHNSLGSFSVAFVATFGTVSMGLDGVFHPNTPCIICENSGQQLLVYQLPYYLLTSSVSKALKVVLVTDTIVAKSVKMKMYLTVQAMAQRHGIYTCCEMLKKLHSVRFTDSVLYFKQLLKFSFQKNTQNA